MGIPVLILGESGSGKSASLRNFEANDVSIFNVAGKPLPFKKKLPSIKTSSYEVIESGLKKSNKKTFVIDDSQYLLAFEMFDRAKELGFGKFTDMALNFKSLIMFIVDQLSQDVIVFLLHHVDTLDNGKIKAKTSGKMLDNQLTVEGLFSIVLLTCINEHLHQFVTQSDGYTTAKSPMEMFELYIDNDLKFVDETIREYYNMKE